MNVRSDSAPTETPFAASLRSLAYAPAGPLGWLNDLRRRALERAHQLTLPTTRDEAWRFTDLAPLYRLAFKPVQTPTQLAAARLVPFTVPEAPTRLVFVDGHYAPALSSNETNAGVLAIGLAEALHTHADEVRAVLGTLAPFDAAAFRAINTATFQDGALVCIGRDQSAPGPVHLLFVSTQAEAASQPRVVIRAATGAAITVIEDYVSLVPGAYCTNAVTEIDVAANASLRHIRLQRESPDAFHIATCAARVARDARFESVSVALGGRISRLDFEVTQAGEGASITLDGLALIGERQLADTHSLVDHAQPAGTSRQLHKCIAGGNAHGVFNGRIVVRPGAQRTDSAQQSRNLLLTPRAHVDAKPQLEIQADDVKAAHGATVGQLDAEEVFYLQSRGIDERMARNLLTYGFAADIVDRIGIPSIHRALHERVLDATGAKE